MCMLAGPLYLWSASSLLGAHQCRVVCHARRLDLGSQTCWFHHLPRRKRTEKHVRRTVWCCTVLHCASVLLALNGFAVLTVLVPSITGLEWVCCAEGSGLILLIHQWRTCERCQLNEAPN